MTRFWKSRTINDPMLRQGVTPLGVIIALAVILRLTYVLLFGYTLNLRLSGYDVYATNLIAGHGYTRFADLHPDSDLPPLYSFFLVAVYTVLGRSAINVALVQIGCDVLTLVAIYAVGRRMGGQSVGLLAAAFTGFYPYLLFQNLSVNDTAIFIALLALGVWVVYRAEEQYGWWWAAAAGLLFGLAALTKTLVVLMLPLIAIWWWRHIGLRKAVILTGALVLTFAGVISPWIVRNTRLHGVFTLISTNDGSNLYQGNNPCVADFLLAGWDAQWVNCLAPTPPGLSEVQEAAWFRDQAVSYLRNNPGEWPRLLAAKFITLWSPDVTPRALPPVAKLEDNAVLQYEQPLFKIARVIHLIYFTPLLILGIVGLWLGWRNRRPIGPVVMVLVSITIAYLIYHPSTRYRSPADPFLFVLAAYALTELWRRVMDSRQSQAGDPVRA